MERVLILNPKARASKPNTSRCSSSAPKATHRSLTAPAKSSPPSSQAREAYERDYILKELDRCLGNVTRAAESLGLERSHLYRKMKALGISTRE